MDQSVATTAEDRAEFFDHNGFLHVPAVFSPQETDELADDLDRLIRDWSFEAAWVGPWREAYLEPELAKRITLSALHDLQLYSDSWARAIVNPRLAEVLSTLLGGEVEFHHTTMHVKPPERGAPFPMHQDHPFYPHEDDRYVDVLLHLDDTNADNGEIRFPGRLAQVRTHRAHRPGSERGAVGPPICPSTGTDWRTRSPCRRGEATWSASASTPCMVRT